MKDFTMIVGAPCVENKNAAEKQKAPSDKKEKVKIDIGGVLDLISDFLDACESRFMEMEKETPSQDEQLEEKGADSAELKPYVVILEASSIKEVPIKAESQEAAVKLAYDMYSTSDVIDFTDADVVSVTPKVLEVEEKSLDEFKAETMTELVRLIRTSDAPDDVLGLVLDRMITDIFEAKDSMTS